MGKIEIRNLCFRYGKQMVLNNLNLDIPENALYGYLGNNGSGKTTTIQVLLGLARPVKGEVLYDGQPFRDQREKHLRKIGLCPGEPFYYDNLTGYEHLAYLDHIYHCGRTAINKVLAITGIENARNKKLRHYSTGMIHRLGMAMALLHDPDILFLDEPLNGLDPEGIHSIRELLLQLHQEGKTVFLSSHLLDEVEKTCTHVGILQHGCLLYQGDLSELLNSIEKRIHIRLDKVDLLHSVCKEVQIDSRIKSESILEVILSNDTTYDRLIELLGQGDYHISAIQPLENTLESVYLKLTSQTK